MSVSELPAVWGWSSFADAVSPPAFGGVADEAERKARWSTALAVAELAVFALGSAVQAILAPVLLGGIFERL